MTLAQKLLALLGAVRSWYKPANSCEKKKTSVRPTHLANVGLYEYPEYNSTEHKSPPKGIALALPIPGAMQPHDKALEARALALEKTALNRKRPGKKSPQRRPLSRSPSVPSIAEETQVEIEGFLGNYVYTEGMQAALVMRANSTMGLSEKIAGHQPMLQLPAKATLAPAVDNRDVMDVVELPTIKGDIQEGNLGNREVEEEKDKELEMATAKTHKSYNEKQPSYDIETTSKREFVEETRHLRVKESGVGAQETWADGPRHEADPFVTELGVMGQAALSTNTSCTGNVGNATKDTKNDEDFPQSAAENEHENIATVEINIEVYELEAEINDNTMIENSNVAEDDKSSDTSSFLGRRSEDSRTEDDKRSDTTPDDSLISDDKSEDTVIEIRETETLDEAENSQPTSIYTQSSSSTAAQTSTRSRNKGDYSKPTVASIARTNAAKDATDQRAKSMETGMRRDRHHFRRSSSRILLQDVREGRLQFSYC